MDMISKGKLAFGGRIAKVKEAGPSLVLSAASIVENSAQGTTIGVAVPVNASNPGAVSIVSQTLVNALAMTGDGITFAVGAAGGATGTLNYEATPSFSVTFEYTDDDGTYQVVRNFTITDVADGPTIAGATTDLETMLGAPQVGVETSGDLDDLFVSPTSQTLTYAVSHGSVGTGNAWTWTPSADGSTNVSVTATDEDGQEFTVQITVDVAAAPAVNNAPVAGNVTLEFLVPPPALGVAPSNTAVPTLSGTAKVGSSLTSTSGTWTGDATITYAYQWQRSDNGSTGWADISGATNSSYTLQAADDTKYVRCEVTATNGVGSDVAVSAASAQITYNVPANTAVPVVTGTEEVGSTLTTDNGTWTNSPTSYTYKWQVSDDGSTGWADISGATSSTYDLTASEDGKYVRSVVTAINSGGNTSANSAASGQITTPASGITGYDTPQKLIDSSASSGPYTGTYIGRQAGEDIVIFVGFLNENSSSAGDPANWTVTLDGQTLTPIDKDAVTLIYCCGALYRASPSNTGNLALSVTTGGSGRACFAIAWPIAGAGATASANTAKNESNSQALTQPNGITTTADNNVILSVCAVKGGDITGLAVSGADGSSTDNTGTNATNDLTFGWAWLKKATAGSVSLAWTWTGSDASWGGYIELPEA